MSTVVRASSCNVSSGRLATKAGYVGSSVTARQWAEEEGRPSNRAARHVPGFANYHETDITVATDLTVRINVNLRLGAVGERRPQGPGRINVALSLRRSLSIRERLKLQIAADASNLLNSTEYNGNYNGGLGSTNLSNNPSAGLTPGYRKQLHIRHGRPGNLRSAPDYHASEVAV
jgi:hypothetical protein